MNNLHKNINKNFTIADNRIMQCTELSFEARGLYFYMLSLPEGWEFSQKRLSLAGNCTEEKIKKILSELFSRGLLTRTFYYNSKGKRKSIYTLYDFDTRNTEDFTTPRNTTLVNTTLVKRGVYKRTKYKKELNIKKERKKERKISSCFFDNSLKKKAEEVFSYWKDKTKLKATLNKIRRNKIIDRLNSYTVEEIKKVIDLIAGSDFHNGKNDRNALYNSIEWICDNDKRISDKLYIIDNQPKDKIASTVAYVERKQDISEEEIFSLKESLEKKKVLTAIDRVLINVMKKE